MCLSDTCSGTRTVSRQPSLRFRASLLGRQSVNQKSKQSPPGEWWGFVKLNRIVLRSHGIVMTTDPVFGSVVLALK
jgi:hypothetical protein